MKASRLLLCLFFLLPETTFGQSSRAKAIDTYLNPYVKAKQFSGVVLVAENGKVIYEKAFGYANADFNIPNQLNTRIGIASITKPMTSIILTRLIEQGKVAMGDKLTKYISDFPNGDKITVEMLARHRAGIPHRVMKPEEESVPRTSAEMVEKIKLANLAFEPGSQSLYSSAGYTLLARVLEIASGKTYSQLLQEYVFTPAGMKDSLDFDGEVIMDRRAQDYMFDARGMINASLKDYSFLVGAGSVFSTARDVYQFGEAIVSGKYGETIKSNFVRNSVLSVNGSTNGHRAFLKINTEKKYAYVLVSNLNCGANDLVLQNLDDLLEGKQVVSHVVPNPKIIPNPNKNLTEFVGRYVRQGGGGSFEIILQNDLLAAGDTKLYPTKPDCFFEYRFYGNVCFVRDNTGAIKEIDWASPTVKSVWIKQ